MQIRKNTLLLVLTFFLSSLSAWGDGTKLGDGSCKFDLETGYQGLSVYTKDSESFIIIDGGDSRYGTISTVYNGLSCREITSGEKSESDFSGVMERKGFTETYLDSKHVMDKDFQNKITFLKNSDELIVHIEPIPNSVTQELNTLLASLSDKSASSQINVSDLAKEFLGYEQFYSKFLNRINSLSSTEINLDYALSLSSILKADTIHEEIKQRIAKLEEETKRRLAKIEEEKKKSAVKYHQQMIKENLKIFAKNYGIDKLMKKDGISWTPDREWDYHSNDHTITGKGKIWFNPDDSILDDVYIKGEFKNNRLISQANLEIDGSVCLLDGIFSCRKSRGASDSKRVTSQNLKSSLSSLSSTVRDRVYERAYGGFNQKKYVGQKVCMSGNALLWKVEIIAYVDSVSGDRIQLRISDTGADNPNYHGTTLRQGVIIWDDYNNWEPC